jgi:hypothetical protein
MADAIDQTGAASDPSADTRWEAASTERAHALIGLAHPQFREELTVAAKKLNLTRGANSPWCAV